MPEGFEYDPETVHACVEALRKPSAKAADFGAAWTRHGADFRVSLAVLAEDLTHLPATLDAVGAAGTTALRDLPPASETDGETDGETVKAADSWEIVGEPLDERVEAVAKVDVEPGPDARRAELRGLHWGRIGEDVDRLEKLAAAFADLAGGLDHAAAEQTFTDYAAAVRAAATGLRTALAGAHTRYLAFRDESLATHLDLGDAEPEAVKEKVRDWYRAADDLKSDVDGLLGPALAILRAVAEARPFSADRQLVVLGRQFMVVDGGIDHVTVTVADGTVDPRTYDLDFDAASAVASEPVTGPSRPSAERVPARTNGQCEFAHGDVTVTVERSLFDASTITLTVNDGVGEPSTHTVEVPPAPVAVRVPEQAGGSDEIAAAGIGWSVHGDLFDSRDPVHSMHGVLVLDDQGTN